MKITSCSDATPMDRHSNSEMECSTEVRPHVLIVDDESLIADSVAAILNRNGFEAVARYCGLDALRYLDEHRPDIVVTDVLLPDVDGIQIAQSVRYLLPNARVLLFSGYGATASLLDSAAVAGPPFEMLCKPVHPATLLETLRAA